MNVQSSASSRPIQRPVHRPAPPPTLTEALDAWVDLPELPAEGDLPAETRDARLMLRVLVLAWQRENEGDAAEDTSALALTDLNVRRLPPAIGQLHNLRQLYVDRVPLTEFPVDVGHLPGLRKIVLLGTHISHLPDFEHGWVNLERLIVRSSRLAELPESIGRLQNLVALDLNSTTLTRLPTSIGQLTKLRSLNLGGSAVGELPAALGQLRGLQRLDLDDTVELRQVPASVVELGQTCHVTARGSGLPADLVDWFDVARAGQVAAQMDRENTARAKSEIDRQTDRGQAYAASALPASQVGNRAAEAVRLMDSMAGQMVARLQALDATLQGLLPRAESMAINQMMSETTAELQAMNAGVRGALLRAQGLSSLPLGAEPGPPTMAEEPSTQAPSSPG